MRHLRAFALAASALAISACGAPVRESAAATPEPPKYTNEWLVSTGPTPEDSGGSLNIHETSLGFAGQLVLKDGAAFPVRNILRTDETLSFMVPAISATYTGTKGSDGGWTGDWTDEKGKRAIVFGRGQAPLTADKWITVKDGRQMYLDCRGAGTPAVIFDAGAGGGSKDWAAVQDEIAKTTTACAYDRPGHGLSDPRPLPLDAATVADDLDEMLSAAGIGGPYVLVGHSLGSYHVRQFANTRFEKTAGMVLVDPSGDGQRARFRAVIPNFVAEQLKRSDEAKAAGCPERLRERLVPRGDPQFAKCNGTNDPDLFEQTQSEIDSMEGASTEQLVTSRRSYGDMPLIVLTRGDYQKGMPPEMTEQDRSGLKQVWETMHAEMAALSTRGEQRFVSGAGHFLQRDQPQAVIDAVNEVVTKARGRISRK